MGQANHEGKIEALFRFIQRDFGLEHMDLTSIEETNLALRDDFRPTISIIVVGGTYRQCPAVFYTSSLTKLTSDQIDFLMHEEPRKVLILLR